MLVYIEGLMVGVSRSTICPTVISVTLEQNGKNKLSLTSREMAEGGGGEGEKRFFLGFGDLGATVNVNVQDFNMDTKNPTSVTTTDIKK